MGLLRGGLKNGRWRPSLLHRLLAPGLSGNTINGLGEAATRRPSYVYHKPGSDHPWARVQNRFYQSIERDAVRAEPIVAGMDLDAEPHAPVAAGPVERSASEWTKAVKAFALGEAGAAVVGIAAMDEAWIFDEVDAASVWQPWIVMLGVPMHYEDLETAPSVRAHTDIMWTYLRAFQAARALANWIRGEGYAATSHGRAIAGKINMIPAAMTAGLGELGKHGSLINRELGSNMRLSAVTTALPLIADAPDDFALDDFCTGCTLCSRACPPQAIADSKQLVRGVQKWYVDFDRCVPYFNEFDSCGLCLGVCPWARPEVAPRLAQKLLRRRARKAGDDTKTSTENGA